MRTTGRPGGVTKGRRGEHPPTLGCPPRSAGASPRGSDFATGGSPALKRLLNGGVVFHQDDALPTALPTVVNVLLAFWPSVVMAPRQTTMIRANITAYSTAVGPSSRARKSTAICERRENMTDPLWSRENTTRTF